MAEREQRRAEAIAVRQKPQPVVPSNPPVTYQLRPDLKYRPNKLDSSDYPGQVVYRRSTIEDVGSEAERGGAAPAPTPGLLNGHNSSPDVFNPFDEGRIEVWTGAGLIKVIRQGRHRIAPENSGLQKKRGKIHGFSRASRRRMMQFLAKVRLDELLPLFGTTTYPDIFPDEAEKFKRDLQTLIERLKRRFPLVGLLWRLEFKIRKSGVNVGKVAPHFHWLLWNVPRQFEFKPEPGKWAKISQAKDGTWRETVKFYDRDKIATVVNAVSGQDRFTEWLSRNWYDVAGTGNLRHYNAGTNVKVLTSKREVFFYVSKYMGKAESEAGCECPGRFWGVVNPKNIPMGKRKWIYCTGRRATQLMRFMRRYVHSVTQRKYRFNRWSMSCLCHADFWLERLPHLLDMAVPLEASSVAAVVSAAAIAEPDYAI
ncbi:MAG TPA: hypothetical protein VMD27_04640 [Candidatus Aquilonibacter sp.]|nr:hypothetical protein [Candidatus Aquilonibacter sp.]